MNDKSAAANVKLIGFDDPDNLASDPFFSVPLTVAWGRAADDQDWKNSGGTRGALLAQLQEFARGPKDGAAITQGELVGPNRIAKNVSANHIMMLDCDTGETLDSLQAKVQRLGLAAVIWTTFSHMKAQTDIKEDALRKFAKDRGDKLASPEDQPALIALVREYLKARKYDAAILDSITKAEKTHGAGGVKFVVSHAPMTRARVMLFLSKPYEFARDDVSQTEAMDDWKAAYRGVADMLGVDYDQSCVDPSRLMYTPRIAPTADITPHAFIVIAGNELDLATVPRVGLKPVSSNVVVDHGNKVPREIIQFCAKYAHDFHINDWLEAIGWENRSTKGDRCEWLCPNDAGHSEHDPDDSAFSTHQGALSGFAAGCLHNSCKEASGGDRAWWLWQIMEATGQTVDDLRAFSPTAADEDKEAAEAVSKAETDKSTAAAEFDALLAKIKEAKEVSGADIAKACDLIVSANPDSRTNQTGDVMRLAKVAAGWDKRTIERTALAEARDRAAAVQAAAAPAPAEQPQQRAGGQIVINSTDAARKQLAAAWEALKQYNEASQDAVGFPRVVVTLDGLTRVEADLNETIQLQPLDIDGTSSELEKAAIFKKHNGQDVFPHKALVRHVYAEPRPPLPPVLRIVNTPIFGPNGELQTAPGAHKATRTLYIPDPGFSLPDLSQPITAEQVCADWAFLTGDLLEGFTFEDPDDSTLQTDPDVWAKMSPTERRLTKGKASRCNAVAMLLVPLMRDMIDGPTPLHFLTKAQARAGGTLLAKAVHLAVYGRKLDLSLELKGGNAEEEFRKQLTARLRAGATMWVIDNLEDGISGGPIASALTADAVSDRVLGVSGMFSGMVKLIWVAVGNNPDASSEIADRCVFIRNVPGVANPEKRTDFKHKNLLKWIGQHRAEIVAACLRIILYWKQQGSKPGTYKLGGFEEWAATMSGIFDALVAAGVADAGHFMANREAFRVIGVSAERSQREAFVSAWWDRYKETPAPVGDHGCHYVAELARGGDPDKAGLLAVLADHKIDLPGIDLSKDAAAIRKRASREFQRLSDMVFDIGTADAPLSVKVSYAYDDHAKAYRYSLRDVTASAAK